MRQTRKKHSPAFKAKVEGVPELFADNHKSQEKAKEAQIDQLYRH